MNGFQDGYFERTVDRTPDRPALDDGDAIHTYSDLEVAANQLAHFLVELGCGPNERVCIFTEKSVETYVGVLGALKSGSCWVPLSTAFPRDRLKSLLASLRPKAVIVCPSTVREASEIQEQAAMDFCLILPDPRAEQLRFRRKERPEISDRAPEDLAYIIFTSGSAGAPKGVMVRHRSTDRFLSTCPKLLEIEPASRFAHFSDLTFDPSIFDLFHCWATGGTLVPLNRRVHRIDPFRFFTERKINVVFCVPSVFAGIRDRGQLSDPALGEVRHLLLTGEPVPARLIRDWYDAQPGSSVYNLYGTTETAIISHFHRFDPGFGADDSVPVGRPLPEMRVRLMQGDRPAPPGEAGESVVSGPQIFAGYWDNELETRAALVPDPLNPELPQRVYRTGDLLRQDKDGLHYFLGRKDTQVKIRGHRIELGEIESALRERREVLDAAVVAVQEKASGFYEHLIAFVTLSADGDGSAIGDDLESKLPSFMIPTRIMVWKGELPRTQNGKVDLRVLKAEAEKAIKP